jgi:hypothetical protein
VFSITPNFYWDRLDPELSFAYARAEFSSPHNEAEEAEVDPLCVDVIVRRCEVTTGDAATLIETGETFEALCARRASEAARSRAYPVARFGSKP